MDNIRVKTAVIIAAAVLLLGITSSVLTCRIADDVAAETKRLQSLPNEAEALERLSEKWDKYEKILSCYIRHSEIEDVGNPIKMLKTCSDDEQLFESECRKIIIAAGHMKCSELPYIWNIL